MKNIILKLIIVIAVPSLLKAQTWDFNNIAAGTDTISGLTITNGFVQTQNNPSGSSGYFAGSALNFWGSGTRSVTMPAVNSAGGSGTLTFKMIYGNSSNGGEQMDGGENVALYYSTNSGSSWTKHTDFALNTYQQSSYTAVSINLTGSLAASSIIYKLEQLPHSGGPYDHWAIDDLVLNTTDVTAPTITATSVAADNSTIAVTFSEAVFNDNNNNTVPVVGDFALSVSGGQASLSSATPSSISTSGGPGSLSFDGTNDYVALSKLDVSSSNGFSFSLWVQKKTGLPSSGSYETVLRQDINGNPDFLLQFTPTQLAFGLNTQLTSYSELKVNISSSDYVDKWVHIAGIYLPSTSYSYLYVNGTLVGNNNNHSGNVTNTTNHVLRIGNSAHNSGSEFFDGLIDEVAIWNEALTSAEIDDIYNSGRGLPVTSNNGDYTSSTGLQGYWKMDEGTGTSVADASTNSNTATITGATWSTDVTPSNIFALGLPLSGIANGSETITVVPASSTAIYDAADNTASTTQSNNTVSLNDKTVAGTPTGLTAVGFYGGAQLNWTAVSGATKYYVYYSTDNSSYTKFSTEPTVDSLDISTLTKGTSYYYKVTSIKSNGAESNKSTATGATKALRGIYVTTSGSDSNSGYSSAKALATLKEAVSDAATLDTIYIAAGTYTFSSSSDGNISINGSKNLVIKGSGSGSTIIDANSKHRHFYFSASSSRTVLDSTFKIMDLTLKNGKPTGNDNGGSVYMSGFWNQTKNTGHAPLFQNIVFESNQISYSQNTNHLQGGAVYSVRSLPYFRDITFKYNSANHQGGAVYLSNADTNKTVTFERTYFVGNHTSATSDGMSAYGGALYLNDIGKVVIQDATFDSNYVAINGACCDNRGGAIYVQSFYDSVIVRDSKFRVNKVYKPSGNDGGSAHGGAIYQSSGYGNFVVTNSLFDSNTAESAMYSYSSGSSDRDAEAGAIRIDLNRFSNNNTYTFPYETILINNTFVNNKALGSGSQYGRGGAIRLEWAQKATLFNNVFWDNRGNNFGSDSARHEIYGYDDSNSQIYMGHNNWQHAKTKAENYGTNNIDRDPQFYGGTGDNRYKLSDASFLIGAGVKTYEGKTAPTKDILGNTRPSGSSTDNPDIGAYENSLAKTTYPNKVAGLTATAANKSAIVSWTANSESNISKYAVYKSTTTGFTPATSDSVGESTSTSFTVTGLTNGTVYYIKVKAVNSSNQIGESSDQVAVTPAFKGVGGWHVAVADSGGASSNEGSKSSPMLYLSDAVTASATGDTILMGGGTHVMTASSRLNITFDGSKKLVIKGAGKDKTIFDANQKQRHFYFVASSSSTLLDTTFKIMDMTLKNGRPSSTSHGGSVFMYGYWSQPRYYGHSPLFQNVIFESNQTKWSTNDHNKEGGAVFSEYGGTPYFRDVTFKSNLTDYRGGAVYIKYADTLKTITFERTNFIKNKVSQDKNENSGQGGAVFLDNTGKVVFESSTFDSNYVVINGECCNNYGGAISARNTYDTLIVRNSKFKYNKVYAPSGNNGGQAKGGAIYANDLRADLLIENSLFEGNSAEASKHTWSNGSSDNGANGGALWLNLRHFQSGQTILYPYKSILVNNTFVNNKALGSGNNNGRGGALYYEWANSTTIFNNVFFGNRGNNNSDSTYHEVDIFNQSSMEIYAGYNNFQHVTPDAANSYGTNNISRDPQFVLDGSGDQYALSDASFLIGAGIKTFEGKTAPTKDILGNARPSGTSTDNPDMGAYENSLAKTTYPDKVASLSGTPASKSVALSWTANSESNISKYAVYQSTTDGFTPASSDSIGESTTTSYTAAGLTNGTPYYFRVKAINTSGQAGEYSDQVKVTPEHKGVGGWHVAVADSGGTATGEGSVASPMLYLSDAVTASASGDTIILGGGTHSYTSSSRLNISFDGSKNLVIKGAGKDKTIIDANQKNRHFKFSGQIDTTFKIMDMTLKNGRPSSLDRGGSVYLLGNWDGQKATATPDPLFINISFEGNQTRYSSDSYNYEGGAVSVWYGAAPQFRDVTFRNNHTTRRGGAVYIQDLPADKNITFERTEFISNYALDYSAQGSDTRGGAIGLYRHQGSINFIHCLFDSNRVEMNGGWNYGGAAIYAEGSEATYGSINITNSRFLNNRVYKPDGKDGGDARGGAININWAATNLKITNSLFYNNSSESAPSTDSNGNVNSNGSSAGAIYIGVQTLWDGSAYQYPGETHLINNTFVNNKALNTSNNSSEGGALRFEWGQKTTMFNNIFYNNEATSRNSSDSDMEVHGLSNSDMVLEIGHNSSNYEETARIFNDYGGDNIWKDAKFLMDGGADQFQLSDASRLIGAGALTYGGVQAPATDILGNARPTIDPDRPDLGAYENANINPPYPDKVAGLVANPADKSAILSWTANTEADLAKYIIYQSETTGFEPTSTDSIGESTTNTYTATGLTNQTYYYFRVLAENNSGNRGELSDEITAYPEYEGPVWWVAMDGANNNDGDEFNPLNDLNEAFKRVHSGDTIVIKTGIYHGGDNAGFVDKDIFDSNGPMNLTIRGETDSPIDVIFTGVYQGQGNGKQRFFVFDRRDYSDKVNIENITFQNEYHNGDNSGYGDGGGAIKFNGAHTELVFKNVLFRNNNARQQGYHNGGGAVAIYVAKGHTPPKFINCAFINNGISNLNSADNAVGGAISIEPGWEGSDNPYNEPSVIIDGCFFSGNAASQSNGGVWRSGSAIQSQANIIIRNSIFTDNYISGGNLGQQADATIELQPQYQTGSGSRHSGKAILINNTFHKNTSGREIIVSSSDDDNARIYLYNNIFSEYNTGQFDSGAVLATTGSVGLDFNAGHNLFDEDQKNYILYNEIQISNGGSDVVGDPSFRGALVQNFELKPNSPAREAGVFSLPPGANDELGGSNAPIFDIRGYYRIGTPDIGAFEFGASKYILALEDDIDGSRDTTFVSLEQEIKFTITTSDIDGNQVSSSEPVVWDVYPNQKYVKISTYDTTTAGGDAVAAFTVSDLERSKGFRFRIRADVGGSPLESSVYVIEEIVTGAPPAVANLTVTPEDWTNKNEFTISWENPTWERDLIGINLLLVDDIGETQSRFEAFPDGSVLTSFTDTLMESGIFTAHLWLVDELGNENPDTRDSVTIKFDNVPPNPFKTYAPASDEWAPPQPTFYFDDAGDYPSGVEEYILFINDNVFKSYGGVNTTGDGAGYVDIDNPLSDGLYNWYMETKDYAGNVTRSDTSDFGVDTQPPTITHSSPLTIIDEGIDTPNISASFSDAASGVKTGRLYHRVSGTTGAWSSFSILSGALPIPAEKVNPSGLDYFIESEDNLGNFSKWPSDKPFQSVRVRSADNITSNTRWSSGVPGGTEINAYQLFSIPFDVGNGKSAITSVMGQSDKFMYRLYKYIGGEEPWQEDPSSVTMSEAYFFIFDPAKYELDGVPTKITFNFGQGTSTVTDPPYEKSISAGDWNLIGSPYNFDMILSNVYTEDGTAIRDAGSLFGFSNGSWSSVSSIKPWQGYAFKSTSATKIIFDGRGSGFNKIAKELDYESIPQDYNEWIIDITAATGQARDELNAVGVRNLAKDGYDPFDEFEPPTLPGDVVLRIDNRDRVEAPDLYSKDIREPNDTGHYWDLQVFAPTNGERTYLTFEGLGYVPEEYDVFLINKTTKQAKNLEWESSYRFANTGPDDYLKQDLRLVIGTKQFVEDNNAGVNLYPDAFTLAQNYPNPFNPQTSIMISLEEDAQVDLIIYNLLGKEISRLAANELRPAGYYNFIWNGRNGIGDKVATGVYFYRALIRNTQGKVVLNKTRKMVFLK